MTVEFVADAETTNGTAGTSVVVSRPTGTTDGHVLVAFIAAVGNPSITKPSGWELIGTQDGSSSVRLAAYYKVASSEPTSWTWTLGSSARNWGWVGAYSGVNTSDPIYDTVSGDGDGTDFNTSFDSLFVDIHRQGGRLVEAVAGVRTASGSATTWTSHPSSDERADLSTNAGSGTDIAGGVSDRLNETFRESLASVFFTASLSQTAMAGWGVALRPTFTSYDGGLVERAVEVAWGADPDGDPDDWTWTDITEDLLDEPGVIVSTGRDERAAIDQPANPTQINLRLRNWRTSDGGITREREGQYTPDNADSPNYPNVVQYVPIRVRQPYGYSPPTTRHTAFVDSWSPSWDASGRAATVDVVAYGGLQRLRDAARPVRSVLHRVITAGSFTGVTPHAYYPCEDGSGSTRVASALPGHLPLQSSHVTFSAADDLGGSGPLPTLPENGVIGGALGPGYEPTGQWCLIFAAKLPSTPVASAARLVAVRCTGTALDWSLWIVPGSPDTLTIRASAYGGTSLLDESVSITEDDHYGQWRLFALGVRQDGADVDYQCWSLDEVDGTGKSGTLAGRTIGAARSVRLVAFSQLAGMAVGHVALYTDPSFDLLLDPPAIAAVALDGNAGDHPITRFGRLCDQLGVQSTVAGTISGSTSISMGPQRPGRVADLLQEAAAADHGIIHDAAPDGSLTLVTRTSLYNQSPALTLDGSLRQVPADVRPVFDASGRVTDSTVSRDRGSSAHYVADDVLGAKPDTKTLSLETDRHLYQIAGWRVALGTVPAMRYTRLPFNLRRSPELTESWLRCGIGSRMQASNMVTAHGPSDPDGIIVGWTETIRRDNWVVEPVLVPARPYDVPVLEADDETAWRLESGGAELAAAATSSDTSLLVATTSEALWSADVDDYPADFDMLGERVTASAVGPALLDTFTRSVSSGLGTPDSSYSGGSYTVVGTASDYAVNGSLARITTTTIATLYIAHIDIGSADGELELPFGVAVVPTGAPITCRVAGRLTDTSNYYEAQLTFALDGSVSLQLFRRVAGAGASVSSGVTLGSTHSAGNTWRIRFRYRGSTLQAKAWKDGEATPSGWQITETDTSLTTGTRAAIIVRRETGSLDGAVNVDCTDFTAYNPQAFTVMRGVSGGAATKAHAAGAAVKLWRGRGLAL